MSQLHDSINHMREVSLRSDKRKLIMQEILQERSRQDSKWGYQHWRHHDLTSAQLKVWQSRRERAKATVERKARKGKVTWQDIAWEEIAEAFAEEEWSTRRTELIQVAAVIAAQIEDGDLKHA